MYIILHALSVCIWIFCSEYYNLLSTDFAPNVSDDKDKNKLIKIYKETHMLLEDLSELNKKWLVILIYMFTNQDGKSRMTTELFSRTGLSMNIGIELPG